MRAKDSSICGSWTAHHGFIRDILSVDNFVWTCADDKNVCVWDAQVLLKLLNDIDVNKTGEKVAQLMGHTSRVFCLAVMNDYVLSGSWDNTIIVWNCRVSVLLIFYFLFFIFYFSTAHLRLF